MIFACDRCGRRYSVPDDRVQGRAFRVTCKACGQVIRVAPGAGAPAAARPAPAVPAPPVTPAAQRPPAPPPLTPAPPPAVAPRAPAPELVAAPEAEREITDADRAWLSDGARAPARETSTTLELTGSVLASADPVRRAERGPGLVRAVVAASILGVAAAGAVALFWPSLRRAPAPARPPAVAAKPPPAPDPAPPPAVEPAVEPAAPPAAPAEPEPDPAPVAAPARAAEPSRAVSRARFEPGTVTVGRVRKKDTPALSRKDRKLLDLLNRKKDGAAPPEPVEALDLDTARSLDPAAVERVVAESQGAFSGCISRNAARGRREHATLLLTVEKTGAVSSAWIAEADVSTSGLGRCLSTAGRRLVFPAFEGPPVDVSVPLLLEAR
ncbi:MAG TPA: zinc-ribbon domain-containing protein [Anaeromyxobacter sp.]|nr:zinc-ribbon domain-containing protein [Anaeromyxobacter sp.]